MGSEQPWRKPCFLKCSTMKIHVSSQLLLLPCIARLAKLQNIWSRQSILKCECWRIFSGRACWAGLRMWTIIFFFFPVWINFKSWLLFSPVHPVPAQMLLPAQRRGQLQWGNEWLWAVQEKRERDTYFSGSGSLCCVEVIVKLQQSHQLSSSCLNG